MLDAMEALSVSRCFIFSARALASLALFDSLEVVITFWTQWVWSLRKYFPGETSNIYLEGKYVSINMGDTILFRSFQSDFFPYSIPLCYVGQGIHFAHC